MLKRFFKKKDNTIQIRNSISHRYKNLLNGIDHNSFFGSSTISYIEYMIRKVFKVSASQFDANNFYNDLDSLKKNLEFIERNELIFEKFKRSKINVSKSHIPTKHHQTVDMELQKKKNELVEFIDKHYKQHLMIPYQSRRNLYFRNTIINANKQLEYSIIEIERKVYQMEWKKLNDWHDDLEQFSHKVEKYNKDSKEEVRLLKLELEKQKERILSEAEKKAKIIVKKAEEEAKEEKQIAYEMIEMQDEEFSNLIRERTRNLHELEQNAEKQREVILQNMKEDFIASQQDVIKEEAYKLANHILKDYGVKL